MPDLGSHRHWGSRSPVQADSLPHRDACPRPSPCETRSGRKASPHSQGNACHSPGASPHPSRSPPAVFRCQLRSRPPGVGSELGDQLGPDRNHADEENDRCQCSGFFNKGLQHGGLRDSLEHMKNIVLILFLESSRRSGRIAPRMRGWLKQQAGTFPAGPANSFFASDQLHRIVARVPTRPCYGVFPAPDAQRNLAL